MADNQNIVEAAEVRAAFRHPELVSGSISPLLTLHGSAKWMLKQVQHDEVL